MEFDPASERALLAGIFQYGELCYYEICDIIKEDCFSKDNKKYWAIVHYLFEKDSTSVLEHSIVESTARVLGFDIENPDEQRYIRALFSLPIQSKTVRKYAQKVAKLKIARQLSERHDLAKQELSNITGDESVSEILNVSERSVLDYTHLLGEDDSGPQQLGDDIEEYVDFLADNPQDIIGVSTGYGLFDAAIGGGMRRQTITMVCARPKAGKTTFADNISLHVSNVLKIPVLMIDTEMGKNPHKNKLLSMLSGIAIHDIETGAFSQYSGDKAKVKSAAQTIHQMSYDYKSVAGMEFNEILAIMQRWVLKTVGKNNDGSTKDCLIIYDYMKLMTMDGLNKQLQEYQIIGFQMSSLHNFAVKYDVPILLFNQLNREGISNDNSASISQSDRLLWLCSAWATLRKKSKEEIMNDGIPKGNLKLLIGDCRFGPGLEEGDYISMRMEGAFAKMTEITAKSEKCFEIEED